MTYKNNYKKEESDLLKENMTPQHIVINNPGHVIIQAPSTPSNIPPYEDEVDSNLQTSIQPPVPDNQIPPYEDEQTPEQIQNNQIQPPHHNMEQIPPYEDENNGEQIPVDPETGQPMQAENPVNPQDQNQIPPYEDEQQMDPNAQPQVDPNTGQPISPNQMGDINQPMDYGYNYDYNTGEEIPSYEDEEVAQEQMPQPQQDTNGIPIDPETGQPMQAGPPDQVPAYEDEPQIDPSTGQPVQQPMDPNAQPQVDPNTGQPIQQGNEIPPYEDEKQIDPNTGQPIQPQIDPATGQPVDPNSMPQQIDPNTGQPMAPQIDPATGQPIPPASTDPNANTNPGDPFAPDPYTSSYTDEKNPELRVGNSSELTTGRPIPVEDLEKLKELKKINTQLMKIKNILEKELDKSYNKVEDKLNEAIEYFRTIISNLDSYVDQVPDIIIKYKRFILTLLTQINILKQQELEEKGLRKKDKDKSDNKSKKDNEKK